MFWILVISILAIYLLLDRLIRLLKVGNYSNKYVFITGCDSGFGRDLVIRLDKLGFPVFAGCLTQDGRSYLEETCSSRVVTLSLNVANKDSIRDAFLFVKQKLPSEKSLWAVVNNAGVPGALGFTEMMSQEDIMSACSVNLFGPIEVSRIFMPLLRKSQGRLVLMTSVMGRFAATPTPYSVSKFGLEAFGDVCRREVAIFGVKVSMIEPGFFKTNILNADRDINAAKEVYSRADPEVQATYRAFVDTITPTVIGTIEESSPDTYKVVDAYVAAITSVYPRPRYLVGYDAKFFLALLSFVPEWLGDWILFKRRKSVVEKYRK